MAAQRSDAARNRETILDAAQQVLSQRPDAGLAEVARAGGLTRTTVYAHFSRREDLVEALVRRAIDSTVAAFDAVDATAGADTALRGMLVTSWQQLAGLGRLTVAAEHVLGDRGTQLHAPVVDRVRSLVRRGRKEGCFRRDVPEGWLVTTYFALVHAAGRDVASGALDAAQAERALTATVLGAFGART